MKSFFWYFLYTLSLTIYSASATCTEKNIYRYERDYSNSFGYDCFHFRRPLASRFTSFSHFGPRRYRQLLISVTVTCSNVSSSIFLNYSQQYVYLPRDLIIQNSLIPKLPSNSSLTKISKLRKLVLKNLSIESISPGAFDGLNTLENLDLSSNRLKEVPLGVFHRLLNLMNLDLRSNSISKLELTSLSGLVRLKKLHLNGNNLTVLPDNVFNDLRVLEVLDISDNPLEEFSNGTFNHLKKLFLKNTRLKKFDINLTQSPLSYVDVSGGHLETINFDKLPSLEKLILFRNRIRIVQNWNKLQSVEVSLNHNNITEVEFPNAVKILQLSHNQIRSLKNEYVHPNNSLIILNLAFNEISVIQKGVFFDFVNLEALRLEHNNITMISENTFFNCPSLKSVDLSHNNIRSISPLAFVKTDQINVLNISHNHLMTVSSLMLSNIHQLKNLYIDHNEMVSFDGRTFENLKTLSINENSWSCEALSGILHILRIKSVNIIDATSLDGDNVDGIACVFDKKS